jgi:transposase
VHFIRWREDGTLEAVHDALREKARVKEGHETTPSAAIIDSQSGKTAQKGRSQPQTSKTAGTTLASISKLDPPRLDVNHGEADPS